MTDPFSLIHDALFEIVQQSNAVKLAVSNYKKNVISGNESRLVGYDSVMPSDLPQIYQTPVGLSGQIMFSSATVALTRGFEFRVLTGEQRPNKMLYPVEFALICALTEANYGQKLRQLEWKGGRFVLSTEIVGSEEGIGSDDNNGIKGWSALFQVEAELSLSRQTLINYNNGVPG